MINAVISKKAYVMSGAKILGDVEIADECGIWPNAVLRGDSGKLTIGKRTNVQDCSVIHSEGGLHVEIGTDVTIGHACIIHGCKIGAGTLVGMGSIVMDNSNIGENCIIGAGSLVTSNTKIPDGMLAFGRPAKVVRPLTQEEIEANKISAQHYLQLAQQAFEDVTV